MGSGAVVRGKERRGRDEERGRERMKMWKGCEDNGLVGYRSLSRF